MYGEELLIGGNPAEAEIMVASINQLVVDRRIAQDQEARRREMRMLQLANMTANVALGKDRRPYFVQN